jgi:hypothetical protein
MTDLQETGYVDETIDSQNGETDNPTPTPTATDPGASGEKDDNFSQLQDRMAGDDPWFSDSEGQMVTKNGEVIVDENGQPFPSEVAFKAWQDKQALPAKPKTDQAVQQKPMSKSFDAFALGDKGLTAQRLYELGKTADSFKYNDDLVPKLDPNAVIAQAEQQIDPVERVKAERQNIEAVAITPFQEIRTALLSKGADPALIDEMLNPILARQQALVNKHYEAQYEKALEQRLDGKYGQKLSKIDDDKLSAASQANVDAIARQYYPEGGKDAFFSLINGHYNEKNEFVRGPSAIVVDLLTSVANEGKTFKTEQERNTSYSNLFRRLTADPVKAKALFDLAHNYWLGKKSHEAQRLVFERGKQAGLGQQQRVNRTIKTKPATYTQPETVDDSGKPSMLKTVMANLNR